MKSRFYTRVEVAFFLNALSIPIDLNRHPKICGYTKQSSSI